MARAMAYAGLGMMLCVCPVWADDAALDMDAPAQSLISATHSSVIPLSSTEEQFNGAPATLDEANDVKDPAIAAALIGNDLFGMAGKATDTPAAIAKGEPAVMVQAALDGAAALGEHELGDHVDHWSIDNDLPSRPALDLFDVPADAGEWTQAGTSAAEAAPENAPSEATTALNGIAGE